MPEDVRRKGSATTLELLRGDIGKRWKLLKHTIVAWTSLPIFRFFCKKLFLLSIRSIFKSVDQTKNPPISTDAPEQEPVINQRRDSTATTIITPARKNDVEEKREWSQRRERLHHLIGLDRSESITITKTPTVESMLKTQRENFGLTMPILGQFVRKYIQHRPRSNFDSVKIHAGKVRLDFSCIHRRLTIYSS